MPAKLAARILVPRFLDAANFNPQNLNAKALLSRFKDPNLSWNGTHCGPPAPEVIDNARVILTRLWPGHCWRLRMMLFYLQPADAIFYPGGVPDAHRVLRLGKWIYPRRRVIATLEGLAGTEEREGELAVACGHQVLCHRIDNVLQSQVDRVFNSAHHIIAISPFLARMGKILYGNKFSVLPLGIDTKIFYPPVNLSTNIRLRVVSAGALRAHKRPTVFLNLARSHPEVDFTWYGEGELRSQLTALAKAQGIGNITFPGQLSPVELAEAFRRADLFVMPSRSEGVPKVTQEAAACGLPVVLFGFYEAPSVIDRVNGRVVWNDPEFDEAIAELIASHEMRHAMGERGAQIMADLDWDKVAPRWERSLLDLVSSGVP